MNLYFRNILKKKLAAILLFTSLFLSPATAQVKPLFADTNAPKDSAALAKPYPSDPLSYVRRGYPSPRKAAILSLVMPGAGQIYNKRWWKLPLVASAGVGLGYLINFNYTFYNRYRTDYQNRLQQKPLEFYARQNPSKESLKAARDATRKNLELSYIGAFLTYVFTAVDAYVDCHLKTFNVSDDDLGWRIQPATFDYESGISYGFSVQLAPKKKADLVTWQLK